jgi:hypothetical protein
VLLLKDHGRPIDSLPFEVDGYFDPVGDLDEGNAAVHSVLLAIESHSPRNRSAASALAGNCKRQLLGLGHAANREVALDLNCVGSGLYNLCPSACRPSFRFRCSRWCLNLDVQNACC